jgi:PAS domain S-box-containing protein
MTKRLKGGMPRKFGLDLVGDAPWGTHLCQFYQTKEDLIDILVPYFAEGLRGNEFCMWVTSPPLEVEEAEAALRKTVPDLNLYLQKGQIEILSYKDWYLLGGTFDSDRVLRGWVEKEKAALRRGLDGLRLTGNTFWLERNGWKAFTAYEEEVNNAIGKYRMIAVCTYSLDKCNANEIIDVIKNHQFALIKRRGKWELIESTEKRKIAENLRETEKKFAALYNSMMEGVALHDVVYGASGNAVDYVITDVNPSFERITGLSKKQAVGKKASELYGTGEPPYLDIYAKVASSGKPASFETYFPPMQKHFNISVFSPSKGKFNTLFHDITERKKKEEILREQGLVINSASDAIFSTDNSFIIKTWNKAAEGIFGWTAEEVIGKVSTSIFNAEYPTLDGTTREQALEQLMNNAFWKGALVYHKKDGSPIPVSASVSLVKDKNGSVVGMVAVLHDISARKRREDELRKTQRDLNRAQAVAKTGSWRLDTRQNVLLWSDETYRMFWIPKGTPLTYETFLGTVHPEDRAYVDAKWNAALRGEPYDIEHRIIVDGEVKWVRERAEMEFDKDGTLTGGFGTVQEITEKKEMEEKLEEYSRHLEELVEEKTRQLKDAERLAAIGETAGMIGHDIRNPLQAIIGELYLSKDYLHSLPEGEAKQELADSMRVVEEQALYINKIVTDLQDYAKPLAPYIENADLEEIAESVLSTVEIPENIEVTYSVEEGFPKLKTDCSYMKRILTNLTANAVQAMPNGGKLTINAYCRDNRAFICVEDTGEGIPVEAKSKLFKPLFTTKAKGQGFGLAVVKKLTEALKGAITFESEEGKGTKFIIEFPKN